MIKIISLTARILIAIVIGVFLVRFAGLSILLPAVAVVYGGILFLLFGIPLLRRAGQSASELFCPDDSHFRLMPEYSVAEARVKQGRYESAIEEFRKVIAQYPEDVYPHLRIADLAVEHLHDLKLAELELLSAVSKAEGKDTSVLAAGRLADFYQVTLRDPARALAVMKQLRDKIPDTKQAKLADERIVSLEEILRGAPQPPKTPDKIPPRRSRYKMNED
jgi:tetratricopeptide (TPR) repeat protein